MENENLMVTIPQSRYEQLLDTETRVDVAVERITNDEYFKVEDVLRVLGTELALMRADEIKEEKEKKSEEYRKRLSKQGMEEF